MSRAFLYKDAKSKGFTGVWPKVTIKELERFLEQVSHPEPEKYYLVTDYINKKREVLESKDLDKFKEENKNALETRKIKIAEYDNEQDMLNDKTKYVVATPFKKGDKDKDKIKLIRSKSAPPIRFFKKDIFNIASKEMMADAIEQFVNNITKTVDDLGNKAILTELMVILKYPIEKDKSKIMYRTHDISSPLRYYKLLSELRNIKEYNEHDQIVVGQLRNYEESIAPLDYSELVLLYKSSSIIGVMIPSTRENIILADRTIIIYSPPYDDKQEYNCLLNILTTQFILSARRKKELTEYIKTAMCTIKDGNKFKIVLNENDRSLLNNFETISGIKLNLSYIGSNSMLETYYKSDYKSPFNLSIDLLLYNDHVYIIESNKPRSSEELIPDYSLCVPDCVEKPIQVFYDFETCYSAILRRHVPFLVVCREYNESNEFIREIGFIGESCAIQMLKYYYAEHGNDLSRNSNECTIEFIGFNSSKFDIFFIIDAYIALDMTPKVTIYKDKLFVEHSYMFWHDILPLMSPTSLDRACKDFGCAEKKLTGQVNFDYLNKVFNDCDCNIDLYLEKLKSITRHDEGCDTISTIYDQVYRYCSQDVKATADLYFTYQRYLNSLLRRIVIKEEGLLKHTINTIQLSRFKTLGQMSIGLFIATVQNKQDIVYKDKKEYYPYQSILIACDDDPKLANMKLTELYKELRSALIASISYAKFNTISQSIHACIDVVSLYPYVLGGDFIYGYGDLFLCIIQKTISGKADFSIIPPGIYYTTTYFSKKKFQRIPYKEGTDSYEWIHDKTIERWLYAQDIIHLVNDGNTVEVDHGYQFSKQAKGSEIFDKYMNVFKEEKNCQDLLKEQKNDKYNPASRECAKFMMNILSGKLVQVYGYEANLVFDQGNKKDFKNICNGSDLMIGESFSIYKQKKKLCTGSKIYDYGLTFGQLYTYSREHMQKMIDKVFEYGYEPKVIETDSIIVEAEFVNRCKKDFPEQFCYNNGNISKNFGEFEVELDHINLLYVYRKKSYCLQYVKKNETLIKYRFKGVNKDSIHANDQMLQYLEWYNEMKTIYALQDKEWQKEHEDMLKNCNFRLSGLISFTKQQAVDLISTSPFALFESLIANKQTTIIQTIIKKNYSSNKNKQLSLENIIVHKTFNKSDYVVSDKDKPRNKEARFNYYYNKLQECPIYEITLPGLVKTH